MHSSIDGWAAMQAFQIQELGHPSTIKPSHVPLPQVKDGEVLVEVHSAGLNFFDILIAQGKYQSRPPLPFTLGAEFAGVISFQSPIPPGCRFKRGDRVLGAAQGAFAEYLACPHVGLLSIPEGVSFDQASTIALTWPTSYEGLVGRGQAKAGDWILIHAAAGGVGLAACQIAKSLGCRVIATASTAEKRKVCTENAGVDHAVDYTRKDWQQEVLRLTGGRGVDVVFDPVGMIMPSLKCVAWNARIVVVGFAAGSIEKIPANLLLLKQVSVTGLFWGPTIHKDPKRAKDVITAVMDLLRSGQTPPLVYEKIYDGLDSVSQGLADLEGRKTWGKGVVRIRLHSQHLAKL